jgi:hypothetical protein
MLNQTIVKHFIRTVHNVLKNSNALVYSEQEIRNVYNHINMVDHLIIRDDLYIAICDKYINAKRFNIDQFKASINSLSKLLNKKIYGIYLTCKDPSYMSFNNLNFTYQLEDVITIYNKDKDDLINDLLNCLYLNKICIYENEQHDVYMLDKTTKWLV